MKRSRALRAIELLEHVSSARLAAMHAKILHLRARRNEVLERSAEAKRALHAQSFWNAFDCAVVSNHIMWSAAASSALSAAQRATLADGALVAREKARWATARVGLMRRVARAEESKSWPD